MLVQVPLNLLLSIKIEKRDYGPQSDADNVAISRGMGVKDTNHCDHDDRSSKRRCPIHIVRCDLLV